MKKARGGDGMERKGETIPLSFPSSFSPRYRSKLPRPPTNTMIRDDLGRVKAKVV